MPCYIEPISKPSKKEFESWQAIGYIGNWEDYLLAKSGCSLGKMFVCGGLGAHCADCARVGDFLCDFPVGKNKTCDRPICEDHGTEISNNMHYCSGHYAEWTDFKKQGGVKSTLANVIAFKSEK